MPKISKFQKNFLKRKNAISFQAERIGEKIRNVLLYFLIRTAKADDLWMSGSYLNDTVIINLTFFPDNPGVPEAIRMMEEALIPFGARPHWGKVFSMGPDKFLKYYPKLKDFK